MEEWADIKKYNIKNGRFQMKIKLPRQIQDMELFLYFRDRKNQEKQPGIHKYPMTIDKTDKNGIILSVHINLNHITFIERFWDIGLYERKNGTKQKIPLKYKGKLEKIKACLLLEHNYHNFKNGYFIYPSVNMDGSISLQYRMRGPYDGIRFKLKERLAFLASLPAGIWLKKKRIILIYEKFSMMAQDNGYYLFLYCMEHDMEKKYHCHIYYGITKDSPDRKNLDKYKDHILDFMSIRYLVYLLNAKLLISTDTKSHAYPWHFRGGFLPFFIQKKKLAFLQHGVTAMKKVDFLYGKNQYGACDYFIVTSDFERRIIEDNFGYRNDEILVTGFARWDVLIDKSQGKKEILLNPTWRNWLESADEQLFLQSGYYQTYMRLLTSEEFINLLEEKNINLNFYLHSKFKEHINEFHPLSKRIHLIPFGSRPLNQLLMSANLLITDYSSVAWDFYYQKKPVIFYQFDRETYLEQHGSYIDLQHELPGFVTDNIDAVIKQAAWYADHGFCLEEDKARRHSFYFKYQDQENCKRIAHALLAK